mmetsp:Transcript_30011/g.89214  ORF Transcript_30011/g.89214 Transcript_30011/m.89214 type:complete len:339 (-) Transcript_30011:40-1056(-)
MELLRRQRLLSFIFAFVALLVLNKYNQSSFASISSHADEPEQTISCDAVPEMVAVAKTPWEINDLRRTLSLGGSSSCVMDANFGLFAEAFRLRHLSTPRKKQLNLHIPKTGGTSLCILAKENSLSTLGTPEHNCWSEKLCPMWCICEDAPPTTCDELGMMSQEFVMNENFLDHPLCDERAYSVVLREPVSRTISHVNHFMEFVSQWGHEMFKDTMGWRLNLIQSNYMAWSLLAGSSMDPRIFEPGAVHLSQAKDTLRMLDFIIDFSQRDECNRVILGFMGMQNTTVSYENSHGHSYKTSYRALNYEKMNEIDIQLYQYALDVMQADCRFFLKLKETLS